MTADRGPWRAPRAPRVPALAIAALLLVPSTRPPRHPGRHTAPHAASQPVPHAVPQAAAPAPVTQTRVQASTRIAPDTVRIGEPFLVVLRVRAPRGATITFPAGPDSGAAVEALDPRTLAVAAESSSTEYSASYRLAAWDVGRQPVSFAPGTIHGGGAAEASVPFGDLTVLVRPTTPADAAHRIPRAARALFAMPRTWWPLWQIAVVALGTIVLLWLLVRWWRRRPRVETPSADPFANATREFGTLDRIGLLDAGELGRYVALAIDITRTYLVRRLAPESMAFTSAELVAAMAEDRRIPQARLGALLAESDRVKFARQSLSPEEARAMGADARRLVEEVEQRVAAAEAAAAAVAAAGTTPSPAGRRDSASGTRGHAA